MVGKATGFVCHGQVMLWLVEQMVLSAMDNNGWRSNQFVLPCTVMVDKSTGFVCHGKFWFFE